MQWVVIIPTSSAWSWVSPHHCFYCCSFKHTWLSQRQHGAWGVITTDKYDFGLDNWLETCHHWIKGCIFKKSWSSSSSSSSYVSRLFPAFLQSPSLQLSDAQLLRLLYTFDIFLPQTKLCTEQLATLTIQRSLRPYSLYLFHIPIPDIPVDRSLADHPPFEDH